MENSILMTLISAVFVSTGFWTFLTTVYNNKKQKQNNLDDDVLKVSKMVLGLGHDRILYLGKTYIERGYITAEEYENLNMYLYKPYKALGGNGTAERVMKDVEKLPFHK